MPRIASSKRILKPNFHLEKKRLPRWKPRRKRNAQRNLLLTVLTGDRATIQQLCLRSGLSRSTVMRAVSGKTPRMTLLAAKRLSRGLGVSIDTFADVLEAYTGWPNAPKRVKKQVSAESSESGVKESIREPETTS
jgi:transcriptional regulator with XRE-family HTH domain